MATVIQTLIPPFLDEVNEGLARENQAAKVVMKQQVLTTILGVVLASGAASVQAAMTMTYSQSTDTQTVNGGPGWRGGEFNVTPGTGWSVGALAGYANSAKQGSAFRSFCLELTEFTSDANPLYAVLNSEAVGGGTDTTNPGGTGDPLSYGTAWLYSQFARGVLAGYNYASTIGNPSARDTSAGLLQEAIWALEDEVSAPVGNIFYNAAVAAFANAKSSAPAGTFGVYALNIYGNSNLTDRKQDMLYFAVPEPSTWFAGIGALCFLGFSALRRHSMNKAKSAA